MKCEYCGGNLTLADRYCPHCGRPNEQVEQHVKDMQKYQGEFETTREEVITTTRKYTALSVRVIMIAIVLLISIVLLILGAKSYSLRRSVHQYAANLHAAEYQQLLDQYLDEEEYRTFIAFFEENSIYPGSMDKYEKYAAVYRIGKTYENVTLDMMKLVSPPTGLEMEQIITTLNEDLDFFYDSLDLTKYQYYEGATDDVYLTCIQNMQKMVEHELVSYANLSTEQASGFAALSKSKRGVILEEAFIDEKS